MGTPVFAVESLRAMCDEGFTPVAVVTAPDKPAGRGLKLAASPVKEFALAHGIPVLQPVRLKDPDFISGLRGIGADLQVVVAFRMLPEQVWSMPRLGTYNLHASLLPAYRGAAPINWALINGETSTGVTTFKLAHEIDSGDVLLSEKVKIEAGDNAGSLHDKLMHTGASLLVETLRMIRSADAEGKSLSFRRQDLSLVSHAPKLTKETGLIDWSLPAERVANLVRGLSPFPGAYTLLETKKGKHTLKIFRASVTHAPGVSPRDIDSDGISFMRVGCADGWLDLLEVQLEGRSRMPVIDFLRGFRPDASTRIAEK